MQAATLRKLRQLYWVRQNKLEKENKCFPADFWGDWLKKDADEGDIKRGAKCLPFTISPIVRQYPQQLSLDPRFCPTRHSSCFQRMIIGPGPIYQDTPPLYREPQLSLKPLRSAPIFSSLRYPVSSILGTVAFLPTWTLDDSKGNAVKQTERGKTFQ